MKVEALSKNIVKRPDLGQIKGFEKTGEIAKGPEKTMSAPSQERVLLKLSVSSLRTKKHTGGKLDIKAGSDMKDSQPACCATLVYPNTECLGCNH